MEEIFEFHALYDFYEVLTDNIDSCMKYDADMSSV